MGEGGGESEGVEETAWVGDALPCDVEGGAVVDAGADDGEAEGCVDCGVEGEGFEGDVALIVVHADDGVGGAASGGDEAGVGGEGTGDIDAAGDGGLDGWGDDVFFLHFSEETVFTGVGVEAADDEFWLFVADTEEGEVGEFDDVEDARGGEEVGDLVIADVDGDEGAGDFLGVLEHAGARGAGAGGEDFGVTWEVDACCVEGFLVERGGGYGGDVVSEGGGDGVIDVGEGGAAGGGVDGAWGEFVRADGVAVDDVGLLEIGLGP